MSKTISKLSIKKRQKGVRKKYQAENFRIHENSAYCAKEYRTKIN